jgi:hypothetical protein
MMLDRLERAIERHPRATVAFLFLLCVAMGGFAELLHKLTS